MSRSGLLISDGKGVPLSAPDLVGPWSVENWAELIPAHRHKRTFHHVHLEVRLKGGKVDPGTIPGWTKVLSAMKEQKVIESSDLASLAVSVLLALEKEQLRLVGSWSLVPGGLFHQGSRGMKEGSFDVRRLVQELERQNGKILTEAVGFHTTLTGGNGWMAEVTLFRVHRARKPALSLDLWGTISRERLQSVLSSLRTHLPVAKALLTRYSVD